MLRGVCITLAAVALIAVCTLCPGAVCVLSNRTPSPLILHTLSNVTGAAGGALPVELAPSASSTAPTPFGLTYGRGSGLTPSGVEFLVPCSANCSVPPLVSAPSAPSFDALTPLFDNSTGFSLELWMRPQSTSSVTASPLQVTGPPSGVEPACGPAAVAFRPLQILQTDDVVSFSLVDDSFPTATPACVTCSSPAGSLVAGQLYHVVVSYPANATGSIALWLNGTAVDCAAQPGAAVLGGNFAAAWSASAGNAVLSMGAKRDGENPWGGAVYLMALYGFELSPSQVAANLKAGPYNVAPLPGNLTVTVLEDSAVVFNLTAHDPEDDPSVFVFTYTGASSRGGTVYAVQSDGTRGPSLSPPAVLSVLAGDTFPRVWYEPALDVFGSDSFEFTVSDGVDVSAPARVFFDVINTDDAPTVLVPPGARVSGPPAGFRANLAALDVTDPDAGTMEVSVTSSAGMLRFEPELAYPGDGAAQAAATAALAAVSMDVGLTSGSSSVLLSGPLGSLSAALNVLGYYKFSRGAGVDTLTVRATHLGVTTTQTFDVESPAAAARIDGAPATLVAGTSFSGANLTLSQPVPCGSTLTLTLGTPAGSAGSVAFLGGTSTVTLGPGTVSVPVEIGGLVSGLALGTVTAATGTGAGSYNFADVVFPITTVLPRNGSIVSVEPRILTFPGSVVTVTVSFDMAVMFGAVLELSPYIASGPGTVGFVDVPGTMSSGASLTFTLIGVGPLYGNVSLGFNVGGNGAAQYARVPGTVVAVFTEVVPQTDSVVSWTGLPEFMRVGTVTSGFTNVTLSAAVQPRGTLVLSAAPEVVLWRAGWMQGTVSSVGGGVVVVEADGTSGFGFRVSGDAPGLVYGRLGLGGNSGGQFDGTQFTNMVITRVLPLTHWAVCDNTPLYVGESCTVLYFLSSDAAVDAVASVVSPGAGSAVVPDVSSVGFTSGSPKGSLTVSTTDADYAGVNVTILLPETLGSGSITSQPIVVVVPDPLVLIAAPRWIKAGAEAKPFVVGLPYAPRYPWESLAVTAQESLVDTSTAPFSIRAPSTLTMSGTSPNATFTLTSQSDTLEGTIHVDLAADTGLASTAHAQYADTLDVLPPITVLTTDCVTYISALDRDLVVDTQRAVVLALSSPVPAGETLEVELVSSGSGRVDLASSSSSGRSGGVGTRAVSVVQVGAGAEYAYLTVTGRTLGWVRVVARMGGGTTDGASSIAVNQVEYAFRVVPSCGYGEVVDCAFQCVPYGSNLGAACAPGESSSILVTLLALLGGLLLFCCLLLVCLLLMRKRKSQEDKEVNEAKKGLTDPESGGSKTTQKSKVVVSKRTVVVLESVTDDSGEYDEYYSGDVIPEFEDSYEDYAGSGDRDRYLNDRMRY